MMEFLKKMRGVLPAIAALGVVDCAWAQVQIHVPTYTGTPMMIAGGVLNQQILQNAARQTAKGGAKGIHERSDASTSNTALLAGSRAANYAAKLAATYPPPQRAAAQRLFAELLTRYQGIEDQFGIPRNDLAGAAAAFVAGSYMGFRNADFPDQNFKALVKQFRSILSRKPEIAGAGEAVKRETYEQLAILGMFMASTQMALKERPDPQVEANMRLAAKGYLEQFLQVGAERVAVTSHGLVIR